MKKGPENYFSDPRLWFRRKDVATAKEPITCYGNQLPMFYSIFLSRLLSGVLIITLDKSKVSTRLVGF